MVGDFGMNVSDNGYIKSLYELDEVYSDNGNTKGDSILYKSSKHMGSFDGIPRARIIETEMIEPSKDMSEPGPFPVGFCY